MRESFFSWLLVFAFPWRDRVIDVPLGSTGSLMSDGKRSQDPPKTRRYPVERCCVQQSSKDAEFRKPRYHLQFKYVDSPTCAPRRTSSCFFFLLICSAPLGAQLADSWPIYVYSSHGYNAVKSRSNPPIYGRIQTRVSFITRERAQSHTCDAVELLGLSRDRYSSWSRVAFYIRLVSTRDG